jgi:exosome complex exonuclease RRP6
MFGSSLRLLQHSCAPLQRDFGLYLVNMFDTGQAARVLGYPSASLAHLLSRHAGFTPDKRFQLADWRLRPLSAAMRDYARCDTHFLLFCYDVLRAELVAAGDAVPSSYVVPLPPNAPQVRVAGTWKGASYSASTAQHSHNKSTAQHSTAQHSTAQHSTAQHDHMLTCSCDRLPPPTHPPTHPPTSFLP